MESFKADVYFRGLVFMVLMNIQNHPEFCSTLPAWASSHSGLQQKSSLAWQGKVTQNTDIFILLLVHSCNMHLLNAFYTGIELGALGNAKMNKMWTSSDFILIEEILKIIVISIQNDLLMAIMSYSCVTIIYKHII